ncbi:cell division septum initiation protein DivIVA [Clostridiales Family XIII bacterium PM5-7]
MADKENKVVAPTTTEANTAFEKMLEEAQAKVGEMLTNAEEKAKEIVEDAQKIADELMATADAGVVQSAEGPSKKEIAEAGKKVSVELFKDTNLYRDDVYVAVNGENIKIQRGKQVEIDQKFKEVLDNSRRQDAASANLNEQLKDDFEQKSTALE